MNRYRGNMLLIELVLALLFFSISMMVILQVFTGAQTKSHNSAVLSEALAQARDIAEQLSLEDNPDTLLLEMGFTGENGLYVFSGEDGYDLTVSIKREERGAGQLVTCTLYAQSGGKELFEFPAARYIPGEAAL